MDEFIRSHDVIEITRKNKVNLLRKMKWTEQKRQATNGEKKIRKIKVALYFVYTLLVHRDCHAAAQ